MSCESLRFLCILEIANCLCVVVPVEVEASYVTIIDSILAATDLNTISAKKIQKGLQQAVEYDITPQKVYVSTAAQNRSKDSKIFRPLLSHS